MSYSNIKTKRSGVKRNWTIFTFVKKLYKKIQLYQHQAESTLKKSFV